MTPMSGAWSEGPLALKSGKPLEVSIGATSPLWFLFGGAAATGMAYWWMTQWVKPVNLEAMMGEAAKALPAPAPEDVAEPEALQAMVEPAFAAPALAAEAEQVAEIVAEPLVEAGEEVVAEITEAAAPAIEAPAPAVEAPTEKAAAEPAAATPAKGKSKARAPIEPPPEA